MHGNVQLGRLFEQATDQQRSDASPTKGRQEGQVDDDKRMVWPIDEEPARREPVDADGPPVEVVVVAQEVSLLVLRLHAEERALLRRRPAATGELVGTRRRIELEEQH